jgi:hypothetical protein
MGAIFSGYEARATIYKNGEGLDLSKLSDEKVQALRQGILQIWKAPERSAILFDVDTYEKRKGRLTDITLVVSAYVKDSTRLDDRRKIKIPSLYSERIVGKRHRITPPQVGQTPWDGTYEVDFTVQ